MLQMKPMQGDGIFPAGLAQAWGLIDASVREKLKAEERMGRICACSQGCDHCCRQPIPLLPAECMAVMAYVRFRIDRAARRRLLLGVAAHAHLSAILRPCPLLLDGVCQAYAARPVACRRFLVSGRRCEPGEDPVRVRPSDMLVPARDALDRAILAMYPWHAENWRNLGLPAPRGDSDGAKLAWMRDITTIIQAINWAAILSPP